MRPINFLIVLLIVVLAPVGESSAQSPPNQDLFYSGVWADEVRSLDIVCSEAEATIDLYFWAWVPPDAGLTYITLRLLYPPEIFEGSRPIFSEFFSELIVVDYGAGGKEWTLLYNQCPSEWVLLFRQPVTATGTDGISISITEGPSLARDCDFALQDMHVLGGVSINGPSCDIVSTGTSTWGAIKSLLD